MEGTAQKDDLACQLPALGQTGHGLVHHRLENRRGDILLASALVQDGLNVALGEHPAPGGDGIDFRMLQGQPVQLVHVHVHQGSHLVDERPGASGAGAVHPLLQRAAEKDDLGVLAAQLNDRVGVGDVCIDGGGGGVHLLDKVDIRRLGHPQPGGAGDDQLDGLAGQPVGEGAQGLAGPLSGFGVVPLVGAEQQFILLVQQHYLDGGAANVDANS